MDILAEKLDKKLREWKPNTASQVRQQIMEIIDLADHDTLDILTLLILTPKGCNIYRKIM
jgi:hypothetical protein